jgi:hypothetical protein
MAWTFRHISWLILLFVTTSPAAADPTWQWKPSTLESRSADMTFDWAIPRLERSPGDMSHWQKLLDRDVRERLNEFQNAWAEAQAENARLRAENPEFRANPWESSGGYQVVWQDPRYLVLLWQGYDYRGGAHGLPVLRVTVLDTERPDALLGSQALFRDQPGLLEALSSASRDGLAGQFAEPLDDWARTGTEARWDNFQVLYPCYLDGPARFEVIFPSYQVAPYAAGTPTVEIPWAKLAPWANDLKDGEPLP